MEDEKIAIRVKNLEKVYKLYNKPSDRVKEALGFGRGKRHTPHHALSGINLTYDESYYYESRYSSSYQGNC